MLIEDERDMRKCWDGKTQCLKEQDLTGRGGEQVSPTHDLIDAHQPIIDDDGELIGKDAIGAAENKVSHGMLDVLSDRSGYEIVECDDAFGSDAEAQGWTPSSFLILSALLHR